MKEHKNYEKEINKYINKERKNKWKIKNEIKDIEWNRKRISKINLIGRQKKKKNEAKESQ